MPSRPAGPARSGQVRGEHRIPLQRLLHADHRACDRGGGGEHRSRGERPARRPGGTDGDRERAEETGVIPRAYNVRSILRRRFSAFATVGGLGLVVFVFAAVLMLARGVRETLKSTGSRENAIILRKGSTSELTSFLPRDAAKTFAADPTVAIEGGRQVASPELFVIFQLQRADGNGTANVGFRGITKDGWELLRSKSIKVVEGRLPQWATSEVMLGRSTVGRYKGARIGDSISIARRQWLVVGIFDAGGSGFDSEVWADADQIADASRRTG